MINKIFIFLAEILLPFIQDIKVILCEEKKNMAQENLINFQAYTTLESLEKLCSDYEIALEVVKES